MSKENKLTIEDAMKYPKAEYSINDWKGKIIEINIPKNSLRLESETGTSFGVSVSDCKLILRSIESLSKEEKEKVNDLTLKDGYDYLRSISVDIDGLEKQGVAVYESEGK